MSTRAAATTGTFDGVHAGHRLLLATLTSEAAERGLRPLAFTFDRHPLHIIAPEREPGMLLSPHWRDELIRSQSALPVILPFTDALRRLPAADFMKMLRDDYGVSLLVVGYDNRFGSDALTTTYDDYRRKGRELGIEVVEAPCYRLEDASPLSSSAVRRMVREGRMEDAGVALGYPYSVRGTVGEGKQLGRKIGFPTANIVADNPHKLLPGEGVYAATATLADGSRYPAAVNIGHRPTVDAADAPLSVEAHLDGFTGNLYDRNLLLTFHSRLRGEERFAGLEELAARLDDDTRRASAIASQAQIPTLLPE